MSAWHRVVNPFLRRAWTGTFSRKPCVHLDQIAEVSPSADVCEECVALGDRWSALRMCLTCGYVGCCDKANNRHAAAHFESTGHPLVRPHLERGMNWVWCRLDETLLDSP